MVLVGLISVMSAKVAVEVEMFEMLVVVIERDGVEQVRNDAVIDNPYVEDPCCLFDNRDWIQRRHDNGYFHERYQFPSIHVDLLLSSPSTLHLPLFLSSNLRGGMGRVFV